MFDMDNEGILSILFIIIHFKNNQANVHRNVPRSHHSVDSYRPPTETGDDAVSSVRLASLFASETGPEAIVVTVAATVDELDALGLVHVKVVHRYVGKAVARVVGEAAHGVWKGGDHAVVD